MLVLKFGEIHSAKLRSDALFAAALQNETAVKAEFQAPNRMRAGWILAWQHALERVAVRVEGMSAYMPLGEPVCRRVLVPGCDGVQWSRLQHEAG